MTVKTSVSLTEEQHAFAKALVEAGRYGSISAVIQQGLDLLRRRFVVEDLERWALHEVMSRRRAGRFIGAEEMDDRLSRITAGKRRDHGVSS